MKYKENILVINEGGIYESMAHAGSHTLSGDEPEELGGKNKGPTAHQYILTALGMCVAITLRMYAERKGWDMQKVEVELNMEKGIVEDKESTIIYKKLKFKGDLDEKQIERLKFIAEKCPVHRTLSGPVYFREFEKMES
ncbi:MAG: OsmC family peroxiredoxin [Bacteroidetes bacterium]|nr:MAG: OsmC family peroxiredoxin [Bacteroidota bacterium]REK00633.1 MAG: OsmC family peroxiredoxin [Bacteroidota bacterium]REK35245.1 MAG: OsmC family peroxiredoxin [Bacteroidota bacterium]REK48322.1 MAG: OsmC family peroxiredoxin [Bacteroidota bacterium]